VFRRPPLNYPDRPYHHFLQDAADRHPEKIGVLFDGESYTYRELDGSANAFANALVGLGFGAGDRAALVLATRPEWVIAAHGISLAGGAIVMPNAAWKEVELRHALELTGPSVVVADAAAAPLIDQCYPGARLRVCVDDALPGWVSFWDLVFGSPGTRPAALTGDLGSMEAALPFSSGTTGLPKAVRHSHRSLVNGIIVWKAASTIGEGDRLHFFLPLFHIYGISTICCALGSGAPIELFRRFDLDRMLEDIARNRITIGMGSAPMAVAMANHPDLERYDLSSLRYFLWAATPISAEVARRVTERTGVRWLHAYGTTEVPALHCNPVHNRNQWRLDTPGLPMSDLEVRVVDIETHEDLVPGAEGEIVVRSPYTMMGYLPDEANDGAFLDSGREWFRTGDIGYVESAGWIHITDRLKDMIKVSGFAVAPVEIEKVLFAHPAVADCAVYGVMDDRKGEVPKAAVVLKQGFQTTAEELISHVAGLLATYKHVRYVEFVDAVPRTASGKILRRELRQREQLVDQ
jgi:acyl-CoA synthetase (AMP-forming)/AMP-acid ligase II